MIAKIVYFETGTKEVKSAHGELFFGDAMFTEYVGVKNSKSRMPYFMIPASTVISIAIENLDEELYTVDVDSLKRSKQAALKRMDYDLKMADSDGRAFQ